MKQGIHSGRAKNLFDLGELRIEEGLCEVVLPNPAAKLLGFDSGFESLGLQGGLVVTRLVLVCQVAWLKRKRGGRLDTLIMKVDF